MTATTKRARSSKARPPPERLSTRSPPTSRPFLRFYHSEALRTRTLSLLERIEEAQDATVYRGELSNLVAELTKCGLDYYFMSTLKLAKPGFVVEQTASLGLVGVQQLMGTVARQIIGRMNGEQLVSVCGSIRRLMV